VHCFENNNRLQRIRLNSLCQQFPNLMYKFGASAILCKRAVVRWEIVSRGNDCRIHCNCRFNQISFLPSSPNVLQFGFFFFPRLQQEILLQEILLHQCIILANFFYVVSIMLTMSKCQVSRLAHFFNKILQPVKNCFSCGEPILCILFHLMPHFAHVCFRNMIDRVSSPKYKAL